MGTGGHSKTIEPWIKASFIIFKLQPHFKNFNRRVVKMSKLYFYDLGLASALLVLQKVKQLKFHPFKVNLLENMVIVKLLKQRLDKEKLITCIFGEKVRTMKLIL